MPRQDANSRWRLYSSSRFQSTEVLRILERCILGKEIEEDFFIVVTPEPGTSASPPHIHPV